MEINVKSKIYIIFGVSAVIVACMVLFLVEPVFSSIKEISFDLVSIKNNIGSFEGEKSQLESFQKNYESYKLSLERMESMFVDGKSPVNFIKFLEASSEKSHVSLDVLMPAPLQNENFVVLQTTARGLPSDILQLVRAIESGTYASEIQNFNMKESVATFSIKIYSK